MGKTVYGVRTIRFAPSDGKPGEGVAIVQTSVKYASSTSGTVKPASEAWSSAIPAVENGLWLWTWTRVVYSDGTETNSYSVARNGIDGKGIKSSSVTYSLQKDSVQPEGIKTWGDFPSELKDGYWLYTRTEMVYSDGASSVSYSVSQVGTGSYYAGTTEVYAISSDRHNPPSGAPAPGTYVQGQSLPVVSPWSTVRPEPTAAEPYIWNFEISADSRGNRYVTKAICIGNFSRGISAIVETYAISSQATIPKGRDYPSDIAESDWQDESYANPPTDAMPYMWNRTETIYNDGGRETVYHVCAVKGADGKGAVYIDLDNENGTLLYDGDGNRIGEGCYATMHLYANGEDVTSGAAFSIEFSSSSVTASLSGNVLAVSHCTTSTGYVIVKSVYDGVGYYARFSVVRIEGTNKYELSCTPSAVTYNSSTEIATPSTVKVEVYKTSQNGMTERMEVLPDGYTLKRYADDASVGVSMALASSAAAFNVSSSVNRYRIELRNDLGILLDYETIPVLHVANGNRGEDGMSIYCQCSAMTIAADSGGKPLSNSNRTIVVYWLKGLTRVADSVISKVVVSGSTFTTSGTYAGISFSFTGSTLTLGFSSSRTMSDAEFEIYVKSVSCNMEKSVKVSVSVARQGSQGVQGIAGAMMRNRGSYTEAQLRATTEELYNNESYIDFIRYQGGDGTYSYYRLKDNVQRWTKAGFYTKAAPSTLVSASAPYLPSVSNSVWAKFDYRDSSAFSFLIASRADIDTATMAQAFIGDNGAVDNGDGTISVGNANGWAISNGQIRHTKTGLALTSDGHIYDPDGLHFKVGNSESAALPVTSLVGAGANMERDPILQDRDHFGTATAVSDGKWAIKAKGNYITQNGSSSAYARWQTQTGTETTTLNWISPWQGDGGHVITLNIASGTCAADREVYLPRQQKNRIRILTSTSTQENVYTFSLWLKVFSLDYVMDYIAGLSVFRTDESSDMVACYLHKAGRLSVASVTAVKVLSSGIADGTDGWYQYHATFKVMSGTAVASGSGTFGDEAWVEWYPVIHPARSNMYVAYAGSKLEKGSVPTSMTYTTQAIRKKLLDTGIDIEGQSIVCSANRWECQNLNGERTAWLDDTGVFTASGVFNNLINVIDWNRDIGRDKLIVTYMDGTAPLAYLGNDGCIYTMDGEKTSKADLVYDSVKVSLDVLRLGDIVRLVSLPSDAVGTSGNSPVSMLLPYYVSEEDQCRTYTRFNALSGSIPRLIKADEMRMLGGRRMTIHSSVNAMYTFLRDHRTSFYTNYMAAEDQIANGLYECYYPEGNYELGSGCSLAGDKVITIECRRAYFYDEKNANRPNANRSGFGYVWVGMQNESLSSFGSTGLDKWK